MSIATQRGSGVAASVSGAVCVAIITITSIVPRIDTPITVG